MRTVLQAVGVRHVAPHQLRVRVIGQRAALCECGREIRYAGVAAVRAPQLGEVAQAHIDRRRHVHGRALEVAESRPRTSARGTLAGAALDRGGTTAVSHTTACRCRRRGAEVAWAPLDGLRQSESWIARPVDRRQPAPAAAAATATAGLVLRIQLRSLCVQVDSTVVVRVAQAAAVATRVLHGSQQALAAGASLVDAGGVEHAKDKIVDSVDVGEFFGHVGELVDDVGCALLVERVL